MEPADAKALIEDAIERAEETQNAAGRADRAIERRFRDRVSLLVGGFAVALAIVHMAAAGAQRDSVLDTVAASDGFAYMQAKIVRETVLTTAAAQPAAAPADRASWRREAVRLRAPDRAGHGIAQLRRDGDARRRRAEADAARSDRYELGETALQLAIVLLSIALVARARSITGAAILVAMLGIGVAIATAAGCAG